MQALPTRPRARQAGYAPPAKSSRNTERPDSNCLIYLKINIGADRKALSGLEPANPVNSTKSTGTPNQSSVAKAFMEFDEAGRMKPSAYFDRVVDVMEELVKFTLLTRDIGPYLVDRYSERKESAEELMKRVNQASI